MSAQITILPLSLLCMLQYPPKSYLKVLDVRWTTCKVKINSCEYHITVYSVFTDDVTNCLQLNWSQSGKFSPWCLKSQLLQPSEPIHSETGVLGLKSWNYRTDGQVMKFYLFLDAWLSDHFQCWSLALCFSFLSHFIWCKINLLKMLVHAHNNSYHFLFPC